MFSNAPSRQEIDRLNAVWDDVVRGNASTGTEAEMARSLQHLAPALDSAAKQRLRTRVLTAQPAVTVPVRSISPATLRTPLAAPKRVRSGVFLRLAAVALLMLSIVGAWRGVRHFGDDGVSPTPFQGAIPASPSDASASPRQTLFQLDIPPAQLREFGIYVMEGNLPPNIPWDLSEVALTLGDQVLSFYVTSGVLSVKHGQTIESYGAGSVVSGVLPSEIRAVGTTPAEFVFIYAASSNEYMQLPPKVTGGFPVIGGVPVKQPAGVPLTVDFSITRSETPGVDPIRASDDERVAMVWVTAGSVMLETPAGESVKTGLGSVGANSMFSPSNGAPTTLNTGQVGMANVDSTLGQHGSVVGNDPFSAYVVTVRQEVPSHMAEDEPQISQGMNWQLPPETQRVGLAMRSITLEPGAVYRYPFSGAVAYYTYVGSVTVEFGDETHDLTSGEMVVQIGSGELTISNPGPSTAVIQQASASTSMPSAQLAQPSDAAVDGVTVNSVAAGDLPVTRGSAEVRLSVIPIDAATTLSHTDQDGVALVVASNGNAVVSDENGLITIGRIHPDSMKTTPGTLMEGDYVLIPSGATYSITGANEHVATLLWFSVTPLQGPATPEQPLTPVQGNQLLSTSTPVSATIEPLPATP